MSLSVEESKAIRRQRLEARRRNRGGIFVPAENNPLIDLLLSRDVSGASPKRSSPRKGHRLQDSEIAQKKAAPPRRKTSNVKEGKNSKVSTETKQKSTGDRKKKRSDANVKRTEGMPSKRSKSGKIAETSTSGCSNRSTEMIKDINEYDAVAKGGTLDPGPSSPKIKSVKSTIRKRSREEPDHDDLDIVQEDHPTPKKRAKKTTESSKKARIVQEEYTEEPKSIQSETKTSKTPSKKGRLKAASVSMTQDDNIQDSHAKKLPHNAASFRQRKERQIIQIASERDRRDHVLTEKSSHSEPSNVKNAPLIPTSVKYNKPLDNDSHESTEAKKAKKSSSNPRSSSKDKKENKGRSKSTDKAQKEDKRSKTVSKPQIAVDITTDSESDPIDFLTRR